MARKPAPYLFVAMTPEESEDLKEAARGLVYWGQVPVHVTIGDTDLDCTGPYNCFDPGANQGVPGVLSLSDASYEPAYKAGPGWDFATGLGSVNASNLVLSPIWRSGTLPK